MLLCFISSISFAQTSLDCIGEKTPFLNTNLQQSDTEFSQEDYISYFTKMDEDSFIWQPEKSATRNNGERKVLIVRYDGEDELLKGRFVSRDKKYIFAVFCEKGMIFYEPDEGSFYGKLYTQYSAYL